MFEAPSGLAQFQQFGNAMRLELLLMDPPLSTGVNLRSRMGRNLWKEHPFTVQDIY